MTLSQERRRARVDYFRAEGWYSFPPSISPYLLRGHWNVPRTRLCLFQACVKYQGLQIPRGVDAQVSRITASCLLHSKMKFSLLVHLQGESSFLPLLQKSALTVPGVQIVIDSTLSRHTRFSPAREARFTGHGAFASFFNGSTRPGRVGRLGLGVCSYNGISEWAMRSSALPEITIWRPRSPLLSVACWSRRLLDSPSRGLEEYARSSLALGAIDEAGQALATDAHLRSPGGPSRCTRTPALDDDSTRNYGTCAAVLSEIYVQRRRL